MNFFSLQDNSIDDESTAKGDQNATSHEIPYTVTVVDASKDGEVITFTLQTKTVCFIVKSVFMEGPRPHPLEINTNAKG